MDLKIFNDTLPVMSHVCECKTELLIESEILVPDYFPQVFKIIKCFVHPVILHKKWDEEKLSIEGYLRCTVYYQAEDDQSICQTEQKIPFTKVLDLPSIHAIACFAQIKGEIEYLNCRALNQRRIEVKGAYILKVNVSAQTEQEIITALSDGGIEQKMLSIAGTKMILNQDKLITAEDEILLSEQPDAVIDISGIGKINEIQIVSGKAVIKGTIEVTITYRSGPGCSLKNIEKSISFNQIVDAEGVQEDSICFAHAEMIGCTLMSAAQEGTASLEVTAMLHLRIMHDTECFAIEDAFSTKYSTELTFTQIENERLVEQIDKTIQVSSECAIPDENAKIIGCFITLNAPEWIKHEDEIGIGSHGTAHIFYLNSLDEIDCCDKSFEYTLPENYADSSAELHCECWADVLNVNTQKAGAEIINTVSIRISGIVFSKTKSLALHSVECCEMLEKEEPDIALHIYYGVSGENVFEIAKKYHTPTDSIMKLNKLNDMILETNKKLLVPAGN